MADEKHPNDKIIIGRWTFFKDGSVINYSGRLDHSLKISHPLNITCNESVNGYKVGRDWDETRDVEGSSLGRKETRHVWEFYFFNQDGTNVGRLDSSSAWLPVPLDMSVLPPDWRSKDSLPKAPPTMSMVLDPQKKGS